MTSQPEALGYLVGTGIGIAVAIALLVLVGRVMKSVARALKPAAVLLGILLTGGGIAIPLMGSQLSAQQQDQINKFFESLADQARGVFGTSAQADEASSESATDNVPIEAELPTAEDLRQMFNPRIDLTSCVKQ